MTFDPFGDFETQGYLRNLAKEKDPDIVRRLEVGNTGDPALKARYEHQQLKRKRD